MSVTSLMFGGALTTQWSPPPSCLSTTTGSYPSYYFIGYHSLQGTDSNCFPPMPTTTTKATLSVSTSSSFVVSTVTSGSGSSQTVYATIISTIIYTSTPYTGYPNRNSAATAAYFSPGICPSGYEYAASFTGGRKGTVYLTASEPESRYLCCPSGYTVQSVMASSEPGLSNFGSMSASAVQRTRTIVNRAYYKYPLCTREALMFTNVVDMWRGWPEPHPTNDGPSDVSLSTTNYFTPKLRATASGIVVGWKDSDTIVTDFIRQNGIKLPTISTSSSTPQPSESPGNSHNRISGAGIGGIVIGSLFAFIIVLWLLCRRGNWKENNKAVGAASRYAGRRMASGTEDPGVSANNNAPTDIEMAENPRTTTPLRRASADDQNFEPPPPRYEEALEASRKP